MSQKYSRKDADLRAMQLLALQGWCAVVNSLIFAAFIVLFLITGPYGEGDKTVLYIVFSGILLVCNLLKIIFWKVSVPHRFIVCLWLFIADIALRFYFLFDQYLYITVDVFAIIYTIVLAGLIVAEGGAITLVVNELIQEVKVKKE